jgi:LmbE family N-acetylglucosaminyl deacetylase
MVMKLVKIIEQYEPDKVFVPFFIENQPDHMIAGKIVAHALKKYNGKLECYCYEVWTPLYPNVLVNITDVIEKKLEALGKHESQLMMIDYVEKIKSLNSYRSITAGKSAKYCEAFLKCSCEDYVKMAQSLGVYY